MVRGGFPKLCKFKMRVSLYVRIWMCLWQIIITYDHNQFYPKSVVESEGCEHSKKGELMKRAKSLVSTRWLLIINNNWSVIEIMIEMIWSNDKQRDVTRACVPAGGEGEEGGGAAGRVQVICCCCWDRNLKSNTEIIHPVFFKILRQW